MALPATPLMRRDFAIAFDVDGVLLLGLVLFSSISHLIIWSCRSGNAVKGAREALQLLLREQVPFVIISNASSRSSTLHRLRYVLGISDRDLPDDRIMLSWSSMKLVSSCYENSLVLLSGLNRSANSSACTSW